MKLTSVGSAILLASLCVSGAATAAEDTVYASAEEVRPLLVGMSIPDGSLADQKGEAVPVGAAHLDGPAIYVFYRGYW